MRWWALPSTCRLRSRGRSPSGTRLAALGVRPRLVHASCSAAGILFPETHHDLLRVGITLYGHWPSRETRVSARATGATSRPAARAHLKTRIVQIKRVAAGGLVGYGCTWRAEIDTRLGVLPVGYHDGYDRALGSAHVLVRGPGAGARARDDEPHAHRSDAHRRGAGAATRRSR